MNITGLFERRNVLKAGALLGGLSALLSRAAPADAQERNDSSAREAVADEARMADIAQLHRKGHGGAARTDCLDRHQSASIHNRVDPETYAGLAMAYYQYD